MVELSRLPGRVTVAPAAVQPGHLQEAHLCDDGEVRAELAEPFDTILDKQLHQRALELANKPPAEQALVERTAVAKPGWQLWEISFNSNAHEEHDLFLHGRCVQTVFDLLGGLSA